MRRLIVCWKQECEKSWWISRKWWSARYCCDVQNVETKLGDGWAKSKLNCGVSWFIFEQILHYLSFLRIVVMFQTSQCWEGWLCAGNKSAKNHDEFFGNGGQHVIVGTFKTSKRNWATAGQNQNSIVEISIYTFFKMKLGNDCAK